ncbi:preprotein translocase subunit SecY [Candidatus Woesearchaeota archaeon]|nr:preprotein translocase subunit SecY [Candidatus Woesearchaeota archaeon]
MSLGTTILNNLPEVKGPIQKKLAFKDKLMWTLIILVAFYLLSRIPLYGLGQNGLQNFESMAVIFGATFGSIMSLGIGPIVTASIVLQLLNGSGLMKFDLTTADGKKTFQGLQKIMAIFFIIFEASIYVFMGGLAPAATLAPGAFRAMEIVLISQLILGGLMVLLMDEVINKWGFGSGISLFILAGVAHTLFTGLFSPLTSTGSIFSFADGEAPIGKIWVLLVSVFRGQLEGFGMAFGIILATLVVFAFSTYAQAMKVEIPLSFGRIRGHGIRWPLAFLYTSNIPVILIAALNANIQLFARLLEKSGHAWLGTFSGQGAPASGVILWLTSPQLLTDLFAGSFQWISLAHALTYITFIVVGSIIFSVFWVQTSGMNAESQAKNIMASGLQVPGFRRDPRVLERILERYIFPLTIMGGALIGVLASVADILGALSRGTGILLAVMIAYKLYEQIAKQHMMDMYPAMRKFFGGE